MPLGFSVAVAITLSLEVVAAHAEIATHNPDAGMGDEH
jgi:hypothetical protein